MTEPSSLRGQAHALPSTTHPLPERTTAEPGVLRFRWPSERWSVPTRCPREHCGSRLLEIDPPTPEGALGEVRCYTCSRVLAELIHDGSRRMTPERFAALPVAPRHPPRHFTRKRCPDCGLNDVTPGRVRCLECRGRVRWDRSLMRKVVELLADGRPVHHRALCGQLGISNDLLRQSVRKLRLRGYTIAIDRSSGLYRLEATP